MHETTCCAPGVFQCLLPVSSDVPLQDGLLWNTWRIYLTHTPQPHLCKCACKSQRAARKIMLEHDLTIQTQHYQQENLIGLRDLKLPSIQHNHRVLLGPWVPKQKFSFNLLLLGKHDLVFVTFSESWFITGVKLKLDSPHCQADQSFPVIYRIPDIKGYGHDSQNTDFSAFRGSVTDCVQFHVLKRSIPFMSLPRKGYHPTLSSSCLIKTCHLSFHAQPGGKTGGGWHFSWCWQHRCQYSCVSLFCLTPTSQVWPQQY